MTGSGNITDYLIMDEAAVTGCTVSEDTLIITADRVIAKPGCELNSTKNNLSFNSFRITMTGFKLKNVSEAARRILSGKGVKEIKERRLYKSEHAGFITRLTSPPWDMFSLTAVPGKNGLIVKAEICFPDSGAYCEAEFSCRELTAEAEEEGVPVAPPKKPTLKERARQLKTEVPAVFFALGHKDTPFAAKLLAAIAAGYAMSPVDLIPDFIPVLGYLDDLIILPLLTGTAIRLIPPEVMDECRKKAAGMGKLPKKWFYALPVILIWIIIIALIAAAVIK